MKARPLFCLYLCFPLFLFFSFSALFPQAAGATKPQSSSSFPSKEPSSGLIRSLEEEIEGSSPKLSQIEERARAALAEYYSQFTEGKKIKYEYQKQRQDYKNLSKNALRLLSQMRERRVGASYFLGEKENLFRLHLLLAKAYARSDKQAKALAEYNMAFRYARIEPASLEEEELLQSLRRQLDSPSSSPQKDQEKEKTKDPKLENVRREESYLWMKKSFAKEDRLSKERDPQIKSEGLRFAEEYKRYEELKKKHKKARSQAALARVKEARGEKFSPTRAQAKEEQKNIEEELEKSRASLEAFRKGAYRSYLERKRELYGDAAYGMALSIKRLDLEKYAFRMQTRPSSYLRGRGKRDALIEEKDGKANSGAFLSALELAHKIDPFHLEYIRLLSDEYKARRKARRPSFPSHSDSIPTLASKKALFFTHLYVHGAEKEREPPKDLSEYSLRLAKLHVEQRNYSRAIENYEKYFQLEESKDRRLEISKRLGDLHYKRGGNRERAKELYQAYLSGTEEKLGNERELRKRSEMQALRCETFESLASIARSQQYRGKEKDYLERARREFSFIEKEKEKQEKELEELKENLYSLQRKLREREDETLENEYYKLKNKKIVEKKEELNWLKSRLAQLNLANLLEKMAWISHNKGLWSEAQKLYTLILEKGSQKQIERSRQNLKNISQSQEDGILRPPILSPDFER